jgi:hypothetical protein
MFSNYATYVQQALLQMFCRLCYICSAGYVTYVQQDLLHMFSRLCYICSVGFATYCLLCNYSSSPRALGRPLGCLVGPPLPGDPLGPPDGPLGGPYAHKQTTHNFYSTMSIHARLCYICSARYAAYFQQAMYSRLCYICSAGYATYVQ